VHSRSLASLCLALGCALVACQAISGLGGFGIQQDTIGGSGGTSGVTNSIANGSTHGSNAVATNGAMSANNVGSTADATVTTAASSTATSTSANMSAASTVGAGGMAASSSASGVGGASGGDHLVFLSQSQYSISSLAVADQACQSEATKSGLTGTWMAVLSGKEKILQAQLRIPLTGDVYLVATNKQKGVLVAKKNDWWTGNHQAAIAVGPSGQGLTIINAKVWSGSTNDGLFVAGGTCNGWADKVGMGQVGEPSSTTNWIDNGTANCGDSHFLYCISVGN
jgi:hypothetical protein